MTPTKIIVTATAITAVLFGAAILRIPQPVATASESRIDGVWANQFEMAVLRKSDRLPKIASITNPEPTPKHPDIVEELPEIMPPILMVEAEPPTRRASHRVKKIDKGNVCTRHHMRKVTIRGGRSWRCRK
jgi:hypothetical protein